MQSAEMGTRAFKAGDLETAHSLLAEAASASHDPRVLVNLGLVLQGKGEIDEAARTLSKALSLEPKKVEFARPFHALARRFVVRHPETLNRAGLKAALDFDTLDLQPMVELALSHIYAQPDLSEARTRAKQGDACKTASDLLDKRPAKILSDELFLKALRTGKNTDPDLERLLVSFRYYLLLSMPPERFEEDRDLYALFLALIAQCIQNEHVWPRSEAETEALQTLSVDREELLSGDTEQARRLGLQLLYQPIEESDLSDVTIDEIARIRPRALAGMLSDYCCERVEEKRLSETIPRYGEITDKISLTVAGQYEKSPYPRWTSLHVARPGGLRHFLSHLIGEDKLTFMDAPFDVLIAGCGTGQQAALSASGYGGMAQLMAIDISLPSLAYAKRMCGKYRIENVEFAQADIQNAAHLKKQFDIVECIGVLHHMASPFAGWQTLLDQLKPGGLMYIGLYSAISRANIAALRADPVNPKPGCSDDDARAYRTQLMSRDEHEPGSELRGSDDFYSLSEFRDLVLHESEQQMTLEQIETFLNENGLVFRGFTLDPHRSEDFAKRYPDDALPGSLSNWSDFEQDETGLFDGMYLFWCEKKT